MRVFFLFVTLITACQNNTGKVGDEKAQQIINKAIEKAGGENFNKATIDFYFRDHHYQSKRNNGVFLYSRIKEDSSGSTHDMFGNEGFKRLINQREIQVPDTMAAKYTSSINSVIYFALLPFGLNDAAVRKEYLGQVEIEGRDLHKIRVTFDEDGGGEDFEDTFIYWINDDYEIDFMAYEFHVDGGGQRFRKAVNPRMINGIRFVDYLNYKPETKGIAIEKIDSLFINGRLQKISEINLENVVVNYPDK